MLCLQKDKVVKRRRWWMTNMHKKRTKESMEIQFQEMLAEPSDEFHNFCRMTLTDFEVLLQKVDPIISKKDTKWRHCVPSKVRLALTLRFLASGDSYTSLHYLFNISSQLISKIVHEVCVALYEVLKDLIKMPTTVKEWLTVERGFHNRFPHAIGAIDGKHVMVQAPINSSSVQSFNIVLLALINSNYCFMFVNIGSQERISDDGILKKSVLGHKMENNLLGLPKPSPLQNGNISLPYVFLGDGAFAFNNLMVPYPGEHQEFTKEIIFNKKLSSARVIVENTFGVMSSVFRVLRRPMLLHPEPATRVVMACVALHNFMRMSRNSSLSYNPPGTFDTYEGDTLVNNGSWRNDVSDNSALRNIPHVTTRSPSNVVEIRNEFAKYLHHRFVLPSINMEQ